MKVLTRTSMVFIALTAISHAAFAGSDREGRTLIGQWTYRDMLDLVGTEWKISVVGAMGEDGRAASYRVGELSGEYRLCPSEPQLLCLEGEAVVDAENSFVIPLSPMSTSDTWIRGSSSYRVIDVSRKLQLLGVDIEVGLFEASSTATGRPLRRYWFSPIRGLVAFQFLRASSLVPDLYEPASFYLLETECGFGSKVDCASTD